MGQHKILKTEKKEMYFVFFSKKQKAYNRESGRAVKFAKLEDGRVVEYTEMCSKERPSGNFINDYVLLGKGDFHHIVGASKYTPEIIRQDEVTISRRKFDPPKLLLLPREKFKLESPKNMLKKRPHGYYGSF